MDKIGPVSWGQLERACGKV